MTSVTTKPNLAISFDVEATSDTPATGSCIMIGFVGVLEDAIPKVGEPWTLFKKQWCIKDYNERGERCMREFWSKYPDNLAYIEKHAQDPMIVVQEISDFLAELSKTYKWYFVADPASFDWAWLSHLYDKFGPVDKTYLGYKAICMDGMQKAMLALIDRSGCRGRGLPASRELQTDESWLDNLLTPPPEYNLKMSHLADDDAEYQAYSFLATRNFFRYNRQYLCVPSPWILRWEAHETQKSNVWCFETEAEALEFVERDTIVKCTTFKFPIEYDIRPLIKKALAETGCYPIAAPAGSERFTLSRRNWMLDV